MSETELLRRIQVAVSKVGARLFRNNNGIGWQGKTNITPTYVAIEHPRPLHAGLCEGSSDLIGWTPVKITSDMVGLTVAIFTAVEVKSPKGRLTEHQKSFLRAVTDAGGIAVCARSIADAVEGISSGRGKQN